MYILNLQNIPSKPPEYPIYATVFNLFSITARYQQQNLVKKITSLFDFHYLMKK